MLTSFITNLNASVKRGRAIKSMVGNIKKKNNNYAVFRKMGLKPALMGLK